jgi:hypothetical protein
MRRACHSRKWRVRGRRRWRREGGRRCSIDERLSGTEIHAQAVKRWEIRKCGSGIRGCAQDAVGQDLEACRRMVLSSRGLGYAHEMDAVCLQPVGASSERSLCRDNHAGGVQHGAMSRWCGDPRLGCIRVSTHVRPMSSSVICRAFQQCVRNTRSVDCGEDNIVNGEENVLSAYLDSTIDHTTH